MKKADRMHKLSMERAGKTHIMSYEKKTSFNSAGHKRQGDNRYQSYPDAPKDNMNPDYCGGTDGSAEGNIPE
jgi:hypothetical protein